MQWNLKIYETETEIKLFPCFQDGSQIRETGTQNYQSGRLRKHSYHQLQALSQNMVLFEAFQQLQELPMKMNMPHVNKTMDVGAAMTAYKVLRNFPNHFKNEMHHLGDFQFTKENFAVIGKLVSGSCFEDAVFQGSLCFSGSLNGIMNGSYYNRCRPMLEVFYECLERLLLEALVNETRVPIPEEVRNMLRTSLLSCWLELAFLAM